MKKYYVLPDLNDPTKLKSEDRTSAAGTICKAPVVDGEVITDIDILDIVDDNGFVILHLQHFFNVR